MAEWMPGRGALYVVPAGGRARAVALVLHGTGGDAGGSAFFDPLAETLSRRGFAIVAPRLPGHIRIGTHRPVVRLNDPFDAVPAIDGANRCSAQTARPLADIRGRPQSRRRQPFAVREQPRGEISGRRHRACGNWTWQRRAFAGFTNVRPGNCFLVIGERDEHHGQNGVVLVTQDFQRAGWRVRVLPEADHGLAVPGVLPKQPSPLVVGVAEELAEVGLAVASRSAEVAEERSPATHGWNM